MDDQISLNKVFFKMYPMKNPRQFPANHPELRPSSQILGDCAEAAAG
ncbi:hypothetical protein [Ahrensia kielensis]|nr:hypothetical protein [Ahrensia kielensis]